MHSTTRLKRANRACQDPYIASHVLVGIVVSQSNHWKDSLRTYSRCRLCGRLGFSFLKFWKSQVSSGITEAKIVKSSNVQPPKSDIFGKGDSTSKVFPLPSKRPLRYWEWGKVGGILSGPPNFQQGLVLHTLDCQNLNVLESLTICSFSTRSEHPVNLQKPILF